MNIFVCSQRLRYKLTRLVERAYIMSDSLDLIDILEKGEVEMIYRRALSAAEWEVIQYNLKTKFWSKMRKDMLDALEDSPDFYLNE